MQNTAERIDPPSRLLLLLEGRALWELGAFFASVPWLRMAPRGDGHPVFVLPGLAASDVSTRPLRAFLADRGYAAYGWDLGANRGQRQLIDSALLPRLKQIRKREGRKVSLIGWSLGGIFARELAKRSPDDVRFVITLGSPFGGTPKSTNAWRLYELLSGRPVRGREHDDLRDSPPVPTTSIYSRSDGVVAWQCSVQRAGPLAENIEIEGSHCGLGHHPLALYAIADRLAQPEGRWAPFQRAGLKSLLYPDPSRSTAATP